MMIQQKKKCEPCSESNCSICKGTKSNNICLNCSPDYYLVNNKCKPYSFMDIYNNDKIDQTVQLINNIYLPYITAMYMDNSEISIVPSYSFSSIRNYTIYFYMNISSINSLSYMFSQLTEIVSIYFSHKFDTKNITNMDYMFHYCSAISLDFSNFNTSKVKSMNGMFAGFRTINFKNFDTPRVTNMDEMFSFCSSLTSLDFSNFNTSSAITMNCMFQYLSELKS